jgi:hypothetical protein
MKKWIILLLLVAVGWFVSRDAPARWRGIPAQAEPKQTTKELPPPFRSGKYTVTPLARYTVTAVVLSRSRYRFDNGAEIAPIDLALGWGPMSIADVINELAISQSGRWYEYSYKEPPLEPQQMATHSANTHCLPADDNIRRKLLSVRRHDLVTLEGFLVEVTAADGYHWRSSLTRDDTGGGACEVMWITGVSRRKL